MLERFVEAMAAGDHTAILALLDEDVVLMSDGGGKVAAATKPLHGSRAVSRFLYGVVERNAGRLSGSLAKVNNEWGGIVRLGGKIDSVFSIRIAGDRISGVYILRNPDKLKRLEPISIL